MGQQSWEEYKRSLRREAREYVRSVLRERSCMTCGNDDDRVLEFHHRDPKQKKMAISTMVSQGKKVKDIREEIEKTDVLCANCHKIYHYNERNGHG